MYYIITLISPPPGKPYEVVYWNNESEQTLEGAELDDSEKGPHGREKALDQDSQ